MQSWRRTDVDNVSNDSVLPCSAHISGLFLKGEENSCPSVPTICVSPNPGSREMAQLIFTGTSVAAGHYNESQTYFLLLYAIHATRLLLAVLSLHFLRLRLQGGERVLLVRAGRMILQPLQWREAQTFPIPFPFSLGLHVASSQAEVKASLQALSHTGLPAPSDEDQPTIPIQAILCGPCLLPCPPLSLRTVLWFLFMIRRNMLFRPHAGN